MEGIISTILIALALAMDAMAVSITNGMIVRTVQRRHVLRMALLFGFFQAAMPIIGWLLGSVFSEYIKMFDHWVAFALLAFIGVRMVIEAVKGEEETKSTDVFSYKSLTVMAIATSIDALAVGVSLALTNENIWLSAAIIGVVCFVLSIFGCTLGKKLGDLFKKRACIAGGVVLVLIGIKILLEHLLA